MKIPWIHTNFYKLDEFIAQLYDVAVLGWDLLLPIGCVNMRWKIAFSSLLQVGESNCFTSDSRNRWEVINPSPVLLRFGICWGNLLGRGLGLRAKTKKGKVSNARSAATHQPTRRRGTRTCNGLHRLSLYQLNADRKQRLARWGFFNSSACPHVFFHVIVILIFLYCNWFFKRRSTAGNGE